jgi:fumarate reductase subunit D
MSRRSNEPLWWAPFSAGMMVNAMVMPALIIITGVLLPVGFVRVEGLREFLNIPLVRAAVFVLVALTFVHAAHRMRFTLVDLGLKGQKGPLAVICYGAAVVGTLIAAYIAFAPVFS